MSKRGGGGTFARAEVNLPEAVPRLAPGERSQSVLRAIPREPSGLIRPHHSKFALANRLADALLVLASLWVAVLAGAQEWTASYLLAGVLGVVLFVLFAEWQDVYRGWRGAGLTHELARIVTAWLGAVVAMLFLAFATKRSHDYSRLVTFAWFGAAPLLVCLWRTAVRFALREVRKRGHNTRSVAIAGAGDLGTRVAQTMISNGWMGLQPIAFFDDQKPRGYRPVEDSDLEVSGSLTDLVKRARAGHVDFIYLALPLRAERRMREVIEALADTTVSVYVIPDLFAFELLHARLVDFGGMPAVSVFENPFSSVNGWVKRLEDIVLGALILTLIALPMLLIALAVKLTSAGPVFFRQRRYGLDGREIIVWKFRSMTVCEDGPQMTQATRGDVRVTRVGAFLRRTSLDELPQFINVLLGTMSVVGPRPHPVALNERYRGLIHGYMLRHKVKPGITGWAQVNGFRGQTERLEKMERRVEHDLWYIRNWSLWLDLKIVVQTVFKGFGGGNAY